MQFMTMGEKQISARAILNLTPKRKIGGNHAVIFLLELSNNKNSI